MFAGPLTAICSEIHACWFHALMCSNTEGAALFFAKARSHQPLMPRPTQRLKPSPPQPLKQSTTQRRQKPLQRRPLSPRQPRAGEEQLPACGARPLPRRLLRSLRRQPFLPRQRQRLLLWMQRPSCASTNRCGTLTANVSLPMT